MFFSYQLKVMNNLFFYNFDFSPLGSVSRFRYFSVTLLVFEFKLVITTIAVFHHIFTLKQSNVNSHCT